MLKLFLIQWMVDTWSKLINPCITRNDIKKATKLKNPNHLTLHLVRPPISRCFNSHSLTNPKPRPSIRVLCCDGDGGCDGKEEAGLY